jgi:hypothetical protein
MGFTQIPFLRICHEFGIINFKIGLEKIKDFHRVEE